LANKALSEATTTNEERRLILLEQAVAELQTSNLDVKTTMGEMRDTQHRDQEKIIGLQTQMEHTNRKMEAATNDIKECRAAIDNVQTKVSSLSTSEDTNRRFDRIESMLAAIGVSTTDRLTNKSITGKRKEDEFLLGDGEEETFADNQENIDTEQETGRSNGNDGSGNQTNSHQEVALSKTRLK
jgi:predicted RNase H-like nuclease (RuvC/YqgF family)